MLFGTKIAGLIGIPPAGDFGFLFPLCAGVFDFRRGDFPLLGALIAELLRMFLEVRIFDNSIGSLRKRVGFD